MSTVSEIIDAVRHLTAAEKDEFLEQLRAVEFEDDWDRQMDVDAKAGKLDFLVGEADDAIRGGTLRDWPDGQEASGSSSSPRRYCNCHITVFADAD